MNLKKILLVVCVSVSLSSSSMELEEKQKVEIEGENVERYEGIPAVYRQEESPVLVEDQNIVTHEELIDPQEEWVSAESEHIQAPSWEYVYQYCPNPYRKKECRWKKCCKPGTRCCVSGYSSGITAVCGLVKLVEWCGKNHGETCAVACSFRECTHAWFPTSCPYVEDGIRSALSWGCSLSTMGGGLTAVGAWLPCWDNRGCNVYKRVRVHRSAQR